MTRLATIVGLLIVGFLMPLNVAAFWLPEGQCTETSAVQTPAEFASVPEGFTDADCASIFDPTDASYNACFELAEHPISTLPELFAQNQAEQVVAALIAKTSAVASVDGDVSPTSTSVEEALLPGRQVVAANIPRPRPRPNACANYPDDCESAPAIPTLNLEVSVPQADSPSLDVEYPPVLTVKTLRGPPAPGVGPSVGVVARLDRPPQVG